MAFIIQDRESGNKIDEFATLEQAQNALTKYEETDKAEGTYTPDFYQIVEIFYTVERTYTDTAERDLFDGTQWHDENGVITCWDDRSTLYLDKETAKKYFDIADKTEWTEKVLLVENKNIIDSDYYSIILEAK